MRSKAERDTLAEALTTGSSRFTSWHFIAAGGFSRVYEAFDLELDRKVALKVASAKEGANVDRIERELEAYRRVAHQNIPELIGQAHFRGRPALVLELLTGETLAEKLAKELFDIAAAIEVTSQLLGALDAVHRAGLLHCDVKPNNVFLHESPGFSQSVKLFDFGSARASGTCPAPDDDIEATPPYMAPEQRAGEPLTAAADIYSVAVVLYALITRRLPFEENGPRQSAQPAIPPRVLRPSCPAELERVIMRALAMRPSYRHPSARVVKEELEWIVNRCSYPRGADALRRRSSVRPAAPEVRAMATRPVLSGPRSRVVDLCDESLKLDPERDGRAPTVLLVEDDEEVRADLSLLLERRGYQVSQAGHGREALAVLERDPLPDVVLLDLMMPVMDGWALRAAMLQDPRLSALPVVILSSAADLNAEAETLEAADYLTKPAGVDEIHRSLVAHAPMSSSGGRPAADGDDSSR